MKPPDTQPATLTTLIDNGIKFFTAAENHQRINNILLGPLERPALKWLAAHMPAWVTPDMLTAFSIFGAMVAFAGYALTNRAPAFMWLASLGFVLNWFGDSLDGTVARYRHIERPKYGFFIDHSVDALTQVFIFLGLGVSPYVRMDVAVTALAAYYMLSVLVYIRTVVTGVFKLSYGKLGPTELRLIAIVSNIVVMYVGPQKTNYGFAELSTYDVIGLVIAGLLFMFFITSMLHQARVIAKMDQNK